MIVPTNRLMLWVAILLPFLALAGMVPMARGLTVLLFAVLFLTATADAIMGRRLVRHIHLSLPEVVRLSKNRHGSIPVHISQSLTSVRQLTIGLPLPHEIPSDNDLMHVNTPADAALSAISWPCRPEVRGCFKITRCYFEISSPAGFWGVRGSSPCRSEIRVYPDLLGDRKQLAALFLNRGLFGTHTQRQIGQGRDFEKLRDYVPGDSFDDIHWKATAKRGRPITKLYQIERTQQIYVILDSSRLSARPSGDQSVLDRFMTAALILGLVAQQQGDLFGLATFSDKVTRFIRAGGGKGHYNICRDMLYTLTSTRTSPDFEELCSFIRLRLRRRALVMILTDLDDPTSAESFLNTVDFISRQHMVIVAMIRSQGVAPLFTNADVDTTDKLYKELAGQIRWNRLRELRKNLQRRGVEFALVENEKLSTELVSRYMSIKARQAL